MFKTTCLLFGMHILIVLTLSFSLLGCAKDGATGPAGQIGPTGPAGESGTDKFIQSMRCFYVISGLTGNAGTALNGVALTYSVGETASGNVFVNADISTTSLQISGSAFYSSIQNGALNGGVVITADFATANSGYWTITSSRTLQTLYPIYNDSSLGLESPVTITPGPSACSLQNF